MRLEIRRRIVELREETVLAGLRDESELKKLPLDEQQECSALWRDADALLFRIDQPR